MPADALMTAEAVRRNIKLPAVGLGTRLLLGEDCSRVVAQAIAVGFRYIDTSPVYGNEAAVGAGIRKSGTARDSIFVTTKVERANLGRDDLRRSVDSSLKEISIDSIDLLLVHWPNGEIPLTDTIAAMAALQREGLLKNIGVANFPIAELDRAIELAAGNGTVIVANQVEVHPSLYQARLIDACRRRGVAVIAYAPTGREDIRHPKVLEIASRLQRSPSQVVLRWHVQLGILPVPIPDTATHDQIARQYEIFDFELSATDMQLLSTVTPSTRYFNPAWAPKWDPLV
jgi:diketogulonate reductase-like aldo/keto reductase